jgi:hypothetical protein
MWNGIEDKLNNYFRYPKKARRQLLFIRGGAFYNGCNSKWFEKIVFSYAEN